MNNTIIDYIKSEFPKVIFNPINLNTGENFSKALGFVISDNKLVMGYISKDGSLCKLIEPLDITKLNNDSFTNLIKKLPIVIGFDENNKNSLLNLIRNGKETKEKEYEDIKKELSDLQNKNNSEYKVLLNNCENIDSNMYAEHSDLILVRNEYDHKIADIKKEYEATINDIKKVNENCRNKILDEKEYIVKSIINFKKSVSDYIKVKDLESSKDVSDIKIMYDKILDEKREIEKTLEYLKISSKEELKKAESKVKDVENELDVKNDDYKNQIVTLTNSMNDIKKELEMYTREKLELQVMNSHKDKCIEKIIIDKANIIEKIKEYNNKWNEWAKSNEYDVEVFKDKLAEETRKILLNLKSIVNHKNEYIKSLKISSDQKEELAKKLNSNAMDIKIAVQRALSDQFIELSAKKERESGTSNTLEIENKNEEIRVLKEELLKVRAKLEQNNNTSIVKDINYTNCYEILQKYMSISNLFSRKSEILSILDKIIYSNSINFFSNLDETAKESIKEKYESVKVQINSYIKFLNIKEYTELSKRYSNTKDNIPTEFCEKLTSVLEYWNQKVYDYRNQDVILTNLYEDLSGAVRVYIKEKPLYENGVKKSTGTISFEVKENKKQKKLVINCPNRTEKIFGEFYGIFDDSFSNLDAYTGIENSNYLLNPDNNLLIDSDALIEDNNTVSPGLYSTFKQVQDGYSIVLFGYGSSGSGKTYSLLGSGEKTPGVLHYGLANLQDVEKISLTNVFEHYFERFSPTGPTITGKIINLIGRLPGEFDNYQKRTDERNLFSNVLGKLDVNIDNLKVSDIYSITGEIDIYRKGKKRIKETPNNPNSSRSHLFMVFKINFKSGKFGYITLVDTAGRESVTEIGNTFLKLPTDVLLAKNKIATALGLSGGVNYIEKIKKDLLKTDNTAYNSRDILEILNEGLFINESINHLVYFFNKKNYKDTKIVMLKDFGGYDTSKYFVDPRSEAGDGDGDEDVSKINPRNNCLMIPIMKFLDNLSKKTNEFKPTKFITLIALRNEESKCDQIYETLDFAENIKSS